MTVSLSYVLFKAAFTAIVASALWFGWFKYKGFPNAEKSTLMFGAMLFVALSIAFYLFELAIAG